MKETIIEGCGNCPGIKSVDEEFKCGFDNTEDTEMTIIIDPDFLDDVPENCPLKGGMILKLGEDFDPDVHSSDNNIED